MWLNGSDKTGIEFIRNDVKPFVHGASKDLKVVVLNEADALSSGQSGAQKILRQLMEDTHKISRYIFLANYDQYIIPEIKSRCQTIAIDNPPFKEIVLFASKILKAEKIECEPKVLIELVKKCYPDIRKVIQVLQENSIDGKLTNINIFSSEEIFKEILDSMLQKDIESTRRLLRSNYVNYQQLYEYLYENCTQFASPGGAILKIAEHMRHDQTIANKEINFIYMFSQMMWSKVIK
jgi:DNA polymerase III delta prime subunit